ncbi:MAG: dermonecrotic toxin domain-containing protein, partial [Pseudomonas sp.]|uniref:dermonecrotic toxin domain-containing protein n=1 Tax=Pseudomonas sp. TaxID=306 RepID=UPI003D6E9D6B
VPQVTLEVIQGPFFADRVDSILALQARNLAYVMTLSTSPDEMTAMIDDALDIRQLLDPRQLQLGTGRWRRDAPFNFADVWPGSRSEPPDTSQALAVTTNSEMGADETPIPAPAGESLSRDQSGSKEDASRAPKASWMELTQAFDMRAERLRQTGVVLREFAEQAVQSYLCVLVEGAVQAGTIRVQWLESEPVDPSDVETVAVAVSESQRSVSMGLVSLLLECVSGHRSLPLPAAVQVVPDSMSGGEHLQGVLINHMLDKLVRGFTDRYVAHFEQSRIEFQRQGDRPLRPDREALSLREDAMHLDLSLNWRLERIDDSANDMVRQILGWPVRSLRMAFDTAMTEAFSVSLTYGGNVVAVLCDTLVLRQPLTQGSPVMFWTGTRGWGQFSSVEDMQAMLQRKLHGAQREGWLALLCERDQALLRNHLLKASDNQVQVRLDRIDGNAIQSLQQQILDRKRQDLRQLCLRAVLCRFESGLFTRLAAVAELDEQLVNTLDGLSLRIDNSIFAAMLPSWLSSASLADLKRYQESLRRFYLVSCEDKDFLFDIPPLRAYAYQRLVAQLTKDFPNQSIDPNQVNVTLRHYVNAFPIAGQLPSAVPAATVVRSEPLTEYAINRFVETQDAAVSVSSVQPDVTRALTPDYLRQLVRGLDVGAGYTTLLRKALATNDPHYAARKRLFIHQLPPLLLALALSEKLKGALSTKAYQFISRVVEMPDGIAPPYLGRDRVIISPLQLIADAGMSPDTVSGAYVICPAARDKGPVVLYVIYHPQFSFREYETRAALIEDIRTNEALQELLLDRLDPEIRRRYAHGGFIEPHLPFAVGLYDVPFRAPGPVTLGMTEVKGNALQFLFRDRIKLLLDVGQSNVVTNDQVDWVGKKFLATLGLEQTLALLPGKLAALVTLWQSHTLFRASAMSASGHRWGKALSEFSAALGVMVAAREQAIEEQTVKDEENEVRPSAAPSTFSWYDTTLNAEQRMRLQSLEANSVALDEMRHDELLNVYFDKRDDTPYAVVDGKVYQVKRLPDEGRLVIVGADGAPGPRLILDTHQQWQLDLSLKLRGGGGIVTKLNSSGAARSAEDVLIVEAKGMSEIRLLYRDRARRIGQAHHQARCYLQTSLDNLNVKRRGAELDPRVKRIIGDFFGTEEPGPELLAEIESAIKGLFDALMEDSLSPFTSPRFVVGSNRSGRDTVVAFVIKTDPKRRVFLTERFFHVPHFDLHPQAAAEGFNATIHYQAANLMHELSHQALDTSDIAYLEAMAPYPDLLREDTPWNSGLRAYVDGLHNHRLSVTALRDNLFTLQDAGTWRDIEPDDDRGYDTILRLTNTTNLNDARDAFLSDVQLRSRVMLSNADSLTLLVLRLGRRSYWVPKP